MRLLLSLLFGALLLALPWHADAAEIQKIAIVVGAQTPPPGRVALRYAHDDARHVADVLVSAAGFEATDVKLLLDPQPAALLAVLDQALSVAGREPQQTFLFFYYSGHADDAAIFPAGQALPFSALKSRLEDPRAHLRLGLLDSCRGGAWTGSKGLKKVEPFDVEIGSALAEEGSVLIASSSGEESAHEAEALHGSFFTHHWNAGLLGAADRGGDGVITLGEAFEYARALTIRDTALAVNAPQHPSFQMKLAGRQDFPLAMMAKQHTTLLFEQDKGPIEFVRLNDGLVVLESTPGVRSLRLGLPAGSYLVRRREPDAVWARVVTLSGGSVTSVSERELARSPLADGRTKDATALPLGLSPWIGERVFAALALGVRHAPVIDPGLRLAASDGRAVYLARGSVRLGDHYWLAGPLALVFDAERNSTWNWFSWVGLPVLAFSHSANDGAVVGGSLGAGFDAQVMAGESRRINVSVSELDAFAWTASGDNTHPPTTWTTQLTLGLSQQLIANVTLNLGAGFGTDLIVDGHTATGATNALERHSVVGLGSVQRTGLRPLPLLDISIGGGFALNAHVVAAYLLANRGWVETYLGGVSFSN